MTATTRIERVYRNVAKLQHKYDDLPSFFGNSVDEGFVFGCLDGFCDEKDIDFDVAHAALLAREPEVPWYGPAKPSDLLADIYEYAYSCYVEYVAETYA